MLLFSIPAVQTSLGKYATNRLNKDFGTNITIEKVGLQFNGDVELINIYIEDHKKDTLASILELNTSVISFRKLYNNKLTFGDVDIEGLILNLKTYKGETDTNLDVFSARFDDDTPSTGRNKFLLSSSDISIVDGEFRLTDENRETPKVFIFKDLNINATDFLILGPDVSARINKLALKDDRGLAISNMTTNFAYTLSEMSFDFLQIKTVNSILKGELRFKYDREDFQCFTDNVRVYADFKDSNIALGELNAFYNEFGRNQFAKFDTNLFGTLNDLYANDLLLSTARRTVIDGDINFKNLFNSDVDFIMDANFERLTSTHNDLRLVMPNILGNTIPPIVDNLGLFTIEGSAIIDGNKLNADLELASNLGTLITILEIQNIDANNAARYSGNIVLDDFDIGMLVDDANVGKASINVDVNGTGFTAESINSQVKGDIFSVGYNGYEYNNSEIVGNVRNKIFDGNLVTNDVNLRLNFNGLIDFSEKVKKYDFTAKVDHANFKAMNFAKNDSLSIFKSDVKMNMNGSNFDDAYGTITFKNTLYKNQNDDYYFKDFAISSRFQEDIRFIAVNSPDIIQGDLSGKFVFNDIPKLLENSLGDIYTNFKPHDISSNQFINFNFKIYNKIAEVFYPDLKLGSNTFFRGRVESDAKKFNLTFSSPQIRLEDYFADNIQLRIDNKNPIYNTYVEVDSINTKYYDVSKFSLINVTKNDTLFIKTEFQGGKGNTDNYDLNLFYTINEDNKSVLGFKKSNVIFKDNEWFINEDKSTSNNKVEFDRQFKDITIKGLKMSHEEEEINLYGILKGGNQKNINLDFKDVDLIKITPRIDSLALAGNVNGKLNIQQQNNVYVPESSVSIDNFKVNDFNLGSFKAYIIGNESLTNYSVNVNLKDDQKESLAVIGNLDFSGNNSSLNLDVNFDSFILNPLNPFGEGVITDIRGEISGNAKVTGRLQRPQINGNLNLDGGGMRIPYLNVDYAFDDETDINLVTDRLQRFVFNNARLIDSEHFSKATLNGSINHVNFSDWALDLDINSDRLLVLNTQDSEDALYFGTAYVNGNINISGQTDELVIDANVASEEGTVFKIPLNDTESFGDNAYIRFLSKEEKEAREKGEAVVISDIKGLEMNFDLDISDNAEIEIVMDKDSGSSIRGRGDGILSVQINTNGKFEMYGDFLAKEGVYNYVYGGLIEKEFKVVPGGKLEWEGDPLKAQINIEAIYDEIEANPSVLLDNPINQSIPIEVKIHLTGELEQPDPEFDLSFPSVNSTLNSELQYRLNDRDSKQLQAISLLLTGSFRNELSFDSQDALGLVSDRLKSMLNDILSSEGGKVELGLDFQLGQNNPNYETDSRVGFTLSTRLSDRILVNGKVGVPIGGVNETVIAGNFEVEMQLNEDRTLSLKFFNRENSIRNFGEQIGYTQGVGLSYNVEFDNLNELFQKLFKPNKSNNIETPKETENALPDYIGFKKKDTLKTKKSSNK